jgi:hypothetical protein
MKISIMKTHTCGTHPFLTNCSTFLGMVKVKFSILVELYNTVINRLIQLVDKFCWFVDVSPALFNGCSELVIILCYKLG